MRSRIEEVKSGLRLAAVLLGTIAIFLLLVGGLHFATVGSPGKLLLGIAMVVFAAVCLLLTSSKWAKWFFGASCVTTLNAILAGLLGRTISTPGIPVSGPLIWELAGSLFIIDLLSYRFAHRKPNLVNSISLVAAIIAIAYSMVVKANVKCMLVAIMFLLVSFIYSRFTLRRTANASANR